MLGDWRNRAAAASAAHFTLATRLRRRHARLGVPVVVLTSVVGTSLFATLSEQQVSTSLRVVIGSFSVAAAILAALQTFFRFGERAEKHVIAADWYAALRRDLDEVLALPGGLRGPPKESLDRLRKEFSKVGQQAPDIPVDLWARKVREFGVREGPVGATSGEANQGRPRSSARLRLGR